MSSAIDDTIHDRVQIVSRNDVLDSAMDRGQPGFGDIELEASEFQLQSQVLGLIPRHTESRDSSLARHRQRIS